MVILEVVFPVFAIALIGYVVTYRKFFGIREIEGISRYVFNIAIPALLFESMSTIELPERINWAFMLSYYVVACLMFGLGMWISHNRFDYSAREQSIFGMGVSYSNAVLIGLPLISGGLGDKALLPLFMLIAVHSAIIFSLVTLFAERNGYANSRRFVARQTLRNMASNPIIIGLVLGLLANFLSLPVPAPLGATIELIGRSALPCALFVLGASLSAYKLAGHFREAWTIVGLKMLVQPLLVAILAFGIFHIDPLWAAVAVMMAAMPVGINTYIFAQKYQACVAPVSSAIVLSTLLAVFTLSALLVVLV